jgi:hypothetical protein
MAPVNSELLDPAVRGSMRVLVESEVMGEQIFGIAERHARSPSDRRMWQALHALEEQTRDGVFDQLGENVDRFGRAARMARAAGTASGSSLWLMPRPLQLRALVLGTKPFLPHFRRLDEHFAGSAKAPFFSYVLAHEHAIAELGRRALAHADDPWTPVEALLGNIPSTPLPE